MQRKEVEGRGMTLSVEEEEAGMGREGTRASRRAMAPA